MSDTPTELPFNMADWRTDIAYRNRPPSITLRLNGEEWVASNHPEAIDLAIWKAVAYRACSSDLAPIWDWADYWRQQAKVFDRLDAQQAIETNKKVWSQL